MAKAHEDLKLVVERLINKIENSNGKWLKPFSNSFPTNYKTKTMYSGINVFNLWFIAEEQQYKTNYWATFKQIKEMGGTVKKGESATNVFFYKPLDIKELNEVTGEEEEKTIFMLRTYNVFNLDQTDLNIEEVKDNRSIEEIDQFIANTGINIKLSHEGAYYNPRLHYIGMPSKSVFKSSELYYATFFHELAHSSGTPLKRDFSGRMNGTEEQLKSYAKEELIAETTRSFLQVEFGLDTTDMEEQNAAYLKSWLKPLKNDPKLLWSIFSEATKAYEYLMKIGFSEVKQEKVA